MEVVNITVTLTPTAIGARSAAVSIADNAPGSPQSISLSGTGAAAVSLSPTTVTFPSQYVGMSGLPQSVTLTNTGTTALNITNVTVSPSDFGALNACGSSVAAGTSCDIGVFFDPTASGTRTGTLTVTDNAGNSPQTASLTGTGQDFSVAASSPSTATVTPGNTANYTVAVAPGGGFNQTVALSCSGAPAQSTCALSSSSVALNGSKPASVTVTVTTAGMSASLAHLGGFPPGRFGLALWLGLSGLSGLVLLDSRGGWRCRKRCGRVLYRLAFLCIFSLGSTWSACGGGSSGGGGGGGGTPVGTYNLTVAGTFTSGSTTLTHNTKLTLVVQ
ncbi:MAG: choice-of-anchor D domain-containing protein [Terriglobales bacterium]